MNIACDARALVGHLTGVGTWTIQIMGGLADAGYQILLAVPGHLELPEALKRPGIRVLPPPPLGLPGTVWLNTLLPWQLEQARAELFIGSLGVIPRRCPVPAVVVVHDLTPRTHPHRHTLANRFCFNTYLRESLVMAGAVVTVSHATEDNLLATFEWIRDRLVCIPCGADRFFCPAPKGNDGSAIRTRFSRGRAYLLHLGTLEPRKGLLDLVAAFEIVHQLMPDGPELVLAGTPGWNIAPLMRRIAASPKRELIHLPGYVSREDARDLLRHAAVFVLASEAEGFGLPLAEALSCGTPAVVTAIPVLTEVGGDAVLSAPVHDPPALARSIIAALDPATGASLRSRALARAPALSWQPSITAWQELLTRLGREQLAGSG